jgi:hypothetical protein
MAVVVVDALEAIEIADDDGNRAAGFGDIQRLL